MNKTALHLYWLKCMEKDKYNKMCLGSNEYSVEVLTLCNLLEWMNIDYQLNKHASYYYTWWYRHNKINKCASFRTHSDPKGKAIWLVSNCMHLSAIKE